MAHVIVAGSGIAASVLACELRKRGRAVTLLQRRPGAPAPLVEALTSDAVHALAALGHEAALRRAGACVGLGFIDAVSSAAPLAQHRWLTYVERYALAQQLLAAALRLGTERVKVDYLPGLAALRAERNHDFYVDATGRAARWTDGVVRTAPRVATLFCGPGAAAPRAGRIVTHREGYAYALFHRDHSTLGIVRQVGTPLHELPEEVARALGVEAAQYAFAGRCPAQAQWAAQAIGETFAAVGDAAFAHEPISGQGVRFAVSSACILAGIIDQQLRERKPNSETHAFYRELAVNARQRHLASLPSLLPSTRASSQPTAAHAEPSAHEVLKFQGALRAGAVFAEGRVQTQPVVQLPDATQQRFLGTLDLLSLHSRLATPQTGEQLVAWLVEQGWTPERAYRALSLCVKHGILGP